MVAETTAPLLYYGAMTATIPTAEALDLLEAQVVELALDRGWPIQGGADSRTRDQVEAQVRQVFNRVRGRQGFAISLIPTPAVVTLAAPEGRGTEVH